MIPAILILSVAPASGRSAPATEMGFPHHGHTSHACSLRAADPEIARLVALAWAESDEAAGEAQKGDDKKRQKAQIQHQNDLKRDRELGKEYSQQVEKELKLSEDAEATARVQRIGGELAAIANVKAVTTTWGDKRLNPFDYSFKVVKSKDDDVNAFSLPGGYIYVYEGLVKYAESDHELAGVLAHEIAHASMRHVATLQRESSKLSAITLPAVLLAILTGGASAAGSVLMTGQLIGQSSMSTWGVKAEQAADFGGFQYMQGSKYDPTGMLTFMERLARDDKTKPERMIDWGIYQTHPPSRERAQSLQARMKEANVPVRRSRVAQSFRAAVVPGPEDTIQVHFAKRSLVSFSGPGAKARADEAAERLNAFFDSVPALYDVKVGAEPGEIVGLRKTLLRLTPADAKAAGTTLPALTDETLKGIKGVLYTLAYRIWEAR